MSAVIMRLGSPEAVAAMCYGVKGRARMTAKRELHLCARSAEAIAENVERRFRLRMRMGDCPRDAERDARAMFLHHGSATVPPEAA